MVSQIYDSRKLLIVLIVMVFGVFSALIIALAYTALTRSVVFIDGVPSFLDAPSTFVVLLLAYVAGVSMIFLPCTLPALFVIVPLSMGHKVRKGITISLLFGAGLITTISLYGLAIAALGKILYLDQLTLAMWLLAGVMAYLFGLSELGLLRITLPSTGVGGGILLRGGDYLKSYLMGVLLGNAGIGCPNPLFYLLLTYIAATASIGFGGVLAALHGIGRAIPLLAISALGILGLDLTRRIATKRETVARLTGWGLIIFAALTLPKPLFGHAWWELSIIHGLWNTLIAATLGQMVAESEAVETILGDLGIHSPAAIYGPWILFAVLLSTPYLIRQAVEKKVEINKLILVLTLFVFSLLMAYTGENLPHMH